ncbi:MAG TPA: SAM-dependent methyltransferase, partial [Polyangiaceae bacterium]|nr:SAM-dependent methyltransferase [Polyangiaceae bacterium]
MKQNPYARPDARTRAAKAQGYPARSVFKLEEIDRRVKLFTPGQRVLDLGAAPGSWSLYAAERVGERGAVRQLLLGPGDERVAAALEVALQIGGRAALDEHRLGARADVQ